MIVTFYSFKGGVGRSMAVANVADILAREGLRVLAIDFDLEAPGLEQYFQIDHRSARRMPGLLDLLLSYKQWMSVTSVATEEPAFRRLDQFILPVYPKLPGGGCLDVLHAGRREPKEEMDRYASSLRSFDWQDFYFNWDGELFFEYLRSALGPPRYDLVIVDSRTGVTEMGGICTYQLADIIVLLTGANHQNRRGTLDVVRDFESLPIKVARSDRPLQMLVVPARVEQNNGHLLETFVKEFESQFANYLPDRLRKKGITFKDLLIPYEPAYAFEERVLSDPARTQERREIAGAFRRLADAVRLMVAMDGDGASDAALAPEDVAPTPTAYDAAKRFASYDVFLSYAAEDWDVVEDLVAELERRGKSIFIDRRELVAGDDWRARTDHALFHSEVCLICFGAVGPSSRHVDELVLATEGAAASHGLRVIPVLLPGAEFSDILIVSFGHTQALDLREGVYARGSLIALDKLFPFSGLSKTSAADARTSPGDTAQPSTASPASAVATISPYPGNRPFTEADAGYLFGRTDSVNTIVQRLESDNVIVVTGPSACGKTSLVHAGVVPEMRKRAASHGASFKLASLEVEDDRMATFDAVLASLGGKADGALIVIDQLERGLRHASKDTLRKLLARVRDIATPAARIILIVRDARLPALREFAPPDLLDEANVVRLPALGSQELRAIIERPAERAGLAFEPGLVERLLTDWGQEQRFLPFLQIVLHDLWLRRREGFLTNRAYDESPDPVEAIAERAYQSLNPELQRCAALVVPRLLTMCGNLLPLGLSCAREELQLSDISEDQLNAIIWHMVDRSLFYAYDDSTGAPRLAPAFTSEQWQRAESWIQTNAKFYDWLEAFSRWRQQYESGGRPEELLLRGRGLEEAERQRRERGAKLTPREIAFIDLARIAARRRQVRRWTAVAMMVAIFAAIAYWGFAARRNRNVESAQDAAVVLQLSQDLAAANQTERARSGFERAEKIYSAAGSEDKVQLVRLYKAANELQSKEQRTATRQFLNVLGWMEAPERGQLSSELLDKAADVSRLFYMAGDSATAARGFALVWTLNDRSPRAPTDLTGHRLSLALARNSDYEGARAAFRAAMIPKNLTGEAAVVSRRSAIDFYELTIKDAPNTTQAYENLALLLDRNRQMWDAVQTIDRGIAVATKGDPPILNNLKATRRDILKSIPPQVRAETPPLDRYICERNVFVTIMSVKATETDRALASVRGRYPLAEAGEMSNGYVPIIADFFLDCDQARRVIDAETINQQGPFAGNWYPGCATCPGLPWRR